MSKPVRVGTVVVDREALVSARLAEGLSQLDLACMSGVSTVTISKIENYGGRRRLETIRILAEYLKVKIDELLITHADVAYVGQTFNADQIEVQIGLKNGLLQKSRSNIVVSIQLLKQLSGESAKRYSMIGPSLRPIDAMQSALLVAVGKTVALADADPFHTQVDTIDTELDEFMRWFTRLPIVDLVRDIGVKAGLFRPTKEKCQLSDSVWDHLTYRIGVDWDDEPQVDINARINDGSLLGLVYEVCNYHYLIDPSSEPDWSPYMAMFIHEFCLEESV